MPKPLDAESKVEPDVDTLVDALVAFGSYINLERAAKERHAAKRHHDGLFRECTNWSCRELRDALQVVQESMK